MKLARLWIYPLKSARGIALPEAELTPLGLKHDRRWMLVNPQGHFLTQRELPRMAKMVPEMTSEGLKITFENTVCEVPFLKSETIPDNATEMTVRVWRSTVTAWQYSPAINQWFSQQLETPCALVYMPDSTFRATNPAYAPDARVSFADGYPYLVTTTASLDLLNQHLEAAERPAVSMARFRPNLVIENQRPFEEDHWQNIQIGQARFEGVKPCERCVIIDTHPQTGERQAGPLETLVSYRKGQSGLQKAVFGRNLIAHSGGLLRVGDKVRVLAGNDQTE